MINQQEAKKPVKWVTMPRTHVWGCFFPPFGQFDIIQKLTKR